MERRYCPICGKELPKYQPCGKVYKSKTCSRSCGAILRSREIESNWKRKEVQEKAHETIKESLLRKYGVDNPAKIEHVKQKIKETNLKKYGHSTILQTDEVKNKSQASRNTEEAKKKMSEHSKLREAYVKGVEAAQSLESIEKRKKTNLERYGVEYALQSKEVREKIKQTTDTKYPIGSLARSEMNRKRKQTCYDHHGVEVGFFAKGYQSTGEAEVREFIQSLGFSGNQNNRVVSGIQLDIYIPEKNFAIEYNGTYWHSDNVKHDRLYHWRRSKLCEENGIRLFHIYEWEWKNETKREIIKSILKILLGKATSRVYARQCEVRKVETKEYRKFCEENHLQGYRHASVVLGLYYKDELKQLMSFNKPQKRNAKRAYQWEIVRGCPGSNNVVVGGISKLWKHFLKEYDPESVMSYCDINKFDGHGYELLGMRLASEERGNLWMIDKKTFKVQQWIFRNKERREEQEKNSYKVYGVGNRLYVWNKE